MAYCGHLGWVGGAHNPLRTDWSPLRKRGIEKIIIVADNDAAGRSAIPLISKQLSMPTFLLQFTHEFPESFDLADPFPPEMFGRILTTVKEETGIVRAVKERYLYNGPDFVSCKQPATWLTTEYRTADSDKPKYKLRENATGKWAFVPNAKLYVNLDDIDLRYDGDTRAQLLQPFAHINPKGLLL